MPKHRIQSTDLRWPQTWRNENVTVITFLGRHKRCWPLGTDASQVLSFYFW